MRLAGRRAVVTGAASGIGRAIAVRAGAEGAKVVLADLDEAGAQNAVEEIREAGGEAHAIATDVADEDSLRSAMTHAAKLLGGLDTIINNAGIVRCAAVTDATSDDWDRMLATNARSVFLAARFGVPLLKEAGGGAIVNVASVAALRPGPGTSIYAASKGAVVALTRALARELAPEGIRVNCVCPGWIDTPFNAPTLPFIGGADAFAELAREIPLGRFGEPQEVAEVVVFLAADGASFVTGQALVIDGGLL